MLKVANYSNVASKEQKEIHQAFHKIAYPNNDERILTTADIIKNGGLLK